VATIKSKEQYFEPDPTGKLFPLLSLDVQYEMVLQYCQIHGDVPEDVRSYFNVAVTLYLYGWLYYPFYTLASERSFFAVEMALRKRLPPKKLNKKGRDPRNLVDLLTEAKDGLMRDEGFRASKIAVQVRRKKPKFSVETQSLSRRSLMWMC
jgi:hypothetical protein